MTVCDRCDKKYNRKIQAITKSFSREIDSFVKSTSYENLCTPCLDAIGSLISQSKEHPFPSQNEELTPGLHYYKEADKIVFTEFYHLSRGFCCGNRCTNCAYGFKSKGSFVNRSN